MKTWQLLKQHPELWERYLVKEKVIRAIRAFFEARNYHELESPILARALPQEHYLEPVTARLSPKQQNEQPLYLIPSTERYNKIALAAGLGEHFVISKVFRGLEDVSPNHAPEFTMLEWYHLNATYLDLMTDTEELVAFIIKRLNNSNTQNLEVEYQNSKLDFTTPWERLSLPKALKEYTGIELPEIQELEKFKAIMSSKGYQVSPADDWEILFELLFANEIEPHLATTRPTFVYDYPKQLCPLTQLSANNPLVAEKVELYLAGKELANGYSELIAGEKLEQNFLEEQALRKLIGKEPLVFDHELVAAVKSGLPKVAGIGMGIDRLVMILANCSSISEINLFPGAEIVNP